VHNYFRKQTGVTFTVLSEYVLSKIEGPKKLNATTLRYSTPQDISRARQAFFSSKKAFLLVSERFHFYKRYKIRGIRNVMFYGPPDHAQYFTEFLSYPFIDKGVEASDVSCRLLWSRYDRFRLERIVGTETVGALMKDV
jgi:U3 small nucleolar RNA-associated protein 25